MIWDSFFAEEKFCRISPNLFPKVPKMSNSPNMNTTTSSANAVKDSSKLNYKDFTWCLSLFGTAVGAGVLLFSSNQSWCKWFLASFSYPGSNRGANDLVPGTQISIARFRTVFKNPEADITDTVEEHFGKTGANLLLLFAYSFATTQSFLSTALVSPTRHSFLVKPNGHGIYSSSSSSVHLSLLWQQVLYSGWRARRF